MSKVRFALLGCGNIARKHAHAVHEYLDDAEIGAFVDLNLARAQEFSAKYGAPAFGSVPDMMRFLRYELEHSRASQSLSATRLLERQRSRRAMICLFLAILELVKLQAVDLTQGDLFGDIGLRRRENFKQALESVETIEAVDREYQ